MTQAYTEYLKLDAQLLHGRACGTLTESEEEPLLDQMDALWYQLTSDEKDQLNKRSFADMEAQRRSFAYGNVAMHNPSVTREDIDKAAELLKKGS